MFSVSSCVTSRAPTSSFRSCSCHSARRALKRRDRQLHVFGFARGFTLAKHSGTKGGPRETEGLCHLESFATLGDDRGGTWDCFCGDQQFYFDHDARSIGVARDAPYGCNGVGFRRSLYLSMAGQ